MLKVKEYFQNTENYFIMDENKEKYYYFTASGTSDGIVHSSSELSYIHNNTTYSILPFTLDIDW